MNEDVLARLREQAGSSTGASARIASIVIESTAEVANMSVTELAESANTTPGTVSRFARAMGYDGFPALRAAVATEHGRALEAGWVADVGNEITPEDPIDKVVGTLANAQMRAVRAAMKAIDLDAAERLAARIAVAERVLLVGEWGDNVPAGELQKRLFRIGVPVWVHEGGYEARLAARLLRAGDVALIFSHNGLHPDAENIFEEAQIRGALTALLTGDPRCELASHAEIVIDSGTPHGSTWTEHFAGRAGDALAAGVLWVLVAQRVTVSEDTAPTVMSARRAHSRK